MKMWKRSIDAMGNALLFTMETKRSWSTDPNKFSNDKLNIAENIIKMPLPSAPPIQELTQTILHWHPHGRTTKIYRTVAIFSEIGFRKVEK